MCRFWLFVADLREKANEANIRFGFDGTKVLVSDRMMRWWTARKSQHGGHVLYFGQKSSLNESGKCVAEVEERYPEMKEVSRPRYRFFDHVFL